MVIKMKRKMGNCDDCCGNSDDCGTDTKDDLH